MMHQFPTPYEDELLFSLLARAGLRSGNVSHKAVLIDIFGSDRFTACIELQPGIGSILSNLPVGSTITAGELIFQNTMYPFFTSFRDKDQADFIYNSLLVEHGRDLHNAIGLMSSTIKSHTYFQYCPFCNQEFLQKNGELYWRRLHQVPGVRICVKHGIWLSESTVLTRGVPRHAFIAPTMENCPDYNAQLIDDYEMLEQYSSIVNNIDRLLNYRYPYHSMDWFYRFYKYQLIRKGYASEKGRVDHQRVKDDFIDYYSIKLLDILQSLVTGESNWLKLIFQKHRKGFHPIRHLLIMQFLGLTLEDVFYADTPELSGEYEGEICKLKRKIMKRTMTPEYRESARNERRETWLLLRSIYPNHSRLDLRKLNSKVYSWLYQYDREFLMKNMPERLPPKSGSKRYDWEKRDREILSQLTKIVKAVVNVEGKPQRLTLKRIQEKLVIQCLMPKHLNKMPLTKEFLEKVVENSEEFNKRRIQWAIKELKVQNEPLTINRIKKMSGVRIVGDITELINEVKG